MNIFRIFQRTITETEIMSNMAYGLENVMKNNLAHGQGQGAPSSVGSFSAALLDDFQTRVNNLNQLEADLNKTIDEYTRQLSDIIKTRDALIIAVKALSDKSLPIGDGFAGTV